MFVFQMYSIITTALVIFTIVFYNMGFKVVYLILSLVVVVYGFPYGDDHYIRTGHGNQQTSGQSGPIAIIYGSGEHDSDELGDFGSGPLDFKDLGAKTLEPIRFEPPRQLRFNGYIRFGPDHEPETSGPLRANRLKPEEFGDRHHESEGFGSEHIGQEVFDPEKFRSKHISPEYVDPEGLRTRYVYKYDLKDSELNTLDEFRPEQVRTEEFEFKLLRPEEFEPRQVSPEVFKPEDFDDAVLGPRYYGFKEFDHKHFVRPETVDIKHNHFDSTPKTESEPDHFERRHFDTSHFVPRIG